MPLHRTEVDPRLWTCLRKDLPSKGGETRRENSLRSCERPKKDEKEDPCDGERGAHFSRVSRMIIGHELPESPPPQESQVREGVLPRGIWRSQKPSYLK